MGHDNASIAYFIGFVKLKRFNRGGAGGGELFEGAGESAEVVLEGRRVNINVNWGTAGGFDGTDDGNTGEAGDDDWGAGGDEALDDCGEGGATGVVELDVGEGGGSVTAEEGLTEAARIGGGAVR